MVKTRRFRGGKKSKRYSHHKRHKHHSTHRRKVKRYSRRGTKRRRRKRTKRVKRGGVRKSVMKGGAFYVIKGHELKIEINTGPPRAFSFGTTDAGAIQEKLNNHPDMPKGMKLADVTMIDKGKEYSGVINSGLIGGEYVTIKKYKNAVAAAKDEEEEMVAKEIFQDQKVQRRNNEAAQAELRRAMEKQAGMRPRAVHVQGEAMVADDKHPATKEGEGESQRTTNFGQGAMKGAY